jgi:hypothetical protein
MTLKRCRLADPTTRLRSVPAYSPAAARSSIPPGSSCATTKGIPWSRRRSEEPLRAVVGLYGQPLLPVVGIVGPVSRLKADH